MRKLPWGIGVAFWTAITMLCTGCMQITGASRIDAWGLKIDANSGFEASAGVMQYDSADNRKGKARTAGRGISVGAEKDEARY